MKLLPLFQFFMFYLLFFISFSILLVTPSFAEKLYPKGTTGYDVSYPQCNGPLPDSPYTFAVLGVTNGKAFTHNLCISDQYDLLKKNTPRITLYMNINFPSGASEAWGVTGPKGICSRSDLRCQGYNYGYNAAGDAYMYASSRFITSPLWWLDVETANYWADDIQINTSVVEGVLRFFQSHGTQVGIYSTPHEWTSIMGNTYSPRDATFTPLPNWLGTGGSDTPLASCFTPFSQGSSVWLVQYNIDLFDTNYGCQ